MRISDWSSDVCSSDLNEVVAPAFKELPEELLGLAELIGVGGVDEVAARLGIGIENATRLVGVGSVPPSRAEHPGSRTDERRAGKAGVSTCRSRWSPDH